MENIFLKEKLLACCKAEIEGRISRILERIREAQDTANNETKSSAGDKYETGRAMMHLEQEKNQGQLKEAQKLLMVLNKVPVAAGAGHIGLGSIVHTSSAKFYLSISLGKIPFGSDVYYAISPATPMGQVLLGMQEGDSALFNGQKVSIERVF